MLSRRAANSQARFNNTLSSKNPQIPGFCRLCGIGSRTDFPSTASMENPDLSQGENFHPKIAEK